MDCSFRMIAMFVYLLGYLGSFLYIIKWIIAHSKVAHQMLLPLQKARRFLLRLQSNNETTTTQSKRGNEVLHIWSANFWVTLVRFSSSKLYTTRYYTLQELKSKVYSSSDEKDNYNDNDRTTSRRCLLFLSYYYMESVPLQYHAAI